MFKIGDTCFFLESNIHVIEGTIRSCVGGKYIVRYGSGKGIRLTEKRLYSCELYCTHLQIRVMCGRFLLAQEPVLFIWLESLK